MHDEILDLVDNNDNVIAQISRNVVWQKNIVNFRAINAFIENDQGQLWIPRRTAHKQRWPLALDVSIGGCVAAGESYEQAFAREALEEVNIDINKVPHTFVTYLSPYTHNVAAFMHVYTLKLNTVPTYNTDDFCEHFWLTPQEVLARIRDGEPCKGDLPELLKIVYGLI